jgi:hypothetical protein
MPALRYAATALNSQQVSVNKNYSPKYLGNSKMNVFGAGLVWSVVIVHQNSFPSSPQQVFCDPQDLGSYMRFMRDFVTLGGIGSKDYWIPIFEDVGINTVGNLSIEALKTSSEEVFQQQIIKEKYSVMITDDRHDQYTLNFSSSVNAYANAFINSVQLENPSGKFDLTVAENILDDIYNLIVLSDDLNGSQDVLISAQHSLSSFRTQIRGISKTQSSDEAAAKARNTGSLDKQKRNIPASSGPNGVSPNTKVASNKNGDGIQFEDSPIVQRLDPLTQSNTFHSTGFDEVASLLDVIRQEKLTRTQNNGEWDITTVKQAGTGVDSGGTSIQTSSNVQPCSQEALNLLYANLTDAEKNSIKLALEYREKLHQLNWESLTLKMNKLLTLPVFDLTMNLSGVQGAWNTGVKKGKEELDALLKGFGLAGKSFSNIYNAGLADLKAIKFDLPDLANVTIPPIDLNIDPTLIINAIKSKYGQAVADAVQCNLNKLMDVNNKSNLKTATDKTKSKAASGAKKIDQLSKQKDKAKAELDATKASKQAVANAEAAAAKNKAAAQVQAQNASANAQAAAAQSDEDAAAQALSENKTTAEPTTVAPTADAITAATPSVFDVRKSLQQSADSINKSVKDALAVIENNLGPDLSATANRISAVQSATSQINSAVTAFLSVAPQYSGAFDRFIETGGIQEVNGVHMCSATINTARFVSFADSAINWLRTAAGKTYSITSHIDFVFAKIGNIDYLLVGEGTKSNVQLNFSDYTRC